MIPGGVNQKKKKNAVQVFSFTVSLENLFFFSFFIRSDQTIKMVKPETKSLSQLYPVPNCSQNGSCAPYVEVTTYLLTCLLERKERKLCFATDLAI